MEAADAAAADRVIYLSGLGVDGDDLSAHLRLCREVERVLAGGDTALTVLRAAIIMGARRARFRMVRQLASGLPAMLSPRWVRTRVHSLAIANLIQYLVGVLAPQIRLARSTRSAGRAC